MVRINLIDPKLLSDEHLLAEHNEIQMLITFILKHPQPKDSDPTEFCLGKGHMAFFRNKPVYVCTRLILLDVECLDRGLNVKIRDNFNKLSERDWSMDYYPTQKDIYLVKQRIRDRIINPLKKKNSFHYYKKEITKDKLLEMI